MMLKTVSIIFSPKSIFITQFPKPATETASTFKSSKFTHLLLSQ